MNYRRNFLQASLATSSLCLVSPHVLASSWNLSSDPYFENIGIQLYTLRNQLAADQTKTIKAVAAAGYKQVELMDVTSAPTIVPLAKENGMSSTSAFFNWELLGNAAPPKSAGSVEQCIERATKHGIKYLVFGYIGKGHRETPDQIKAIAERSNKAGELCEKAGLKLCYHHHSFEFEKLNTGKTGMDLFIENFDPKLVSFEIDVFWCAIGGWDPIETLKRLKGRVSQVHLKDLEKGTPTIYDEGKVPATAFKEVGAGTIDMKAVLDTAREIGVAQCHVEQDQSSDPIVSINSSYKYLASL
ncbi:MAG: sugar phosphate isomerase/epimerase family protein [Pirellula sp.]|jgi:sugar phosphate isomerase/epimerase